MKPSEQQQKNEMLSAFVDAEQSDSEISQIVDALLTDNNYKERYIRAQALNNYLHDQSQSHGLAIDSKSYSGNSSGGNSAYYSTKELDSKLRLNISNALRDIPEHQSFDNDNNHSINVNSQTLPPQTSLLQSFSDSLFDSLFKHKIMTGLSVAASVMFVTLFTLQNVVTQTDHNPDMAINQPGHSLIQSQAKQPVNLVTSPNTLPINAQYQWIKADPEVSKQIKQYVKEHESYRSSYYSAPNLQPKLRTVNYSTTR